MQNFSNNISGCFSSLFNFNSYC